MKKTKDELWAEYKKNRRQQIRDALIEEYAYLVKIVAARLRAKYGTYIDYDDLCGYGVFGLIDAIDKFEDDKGAKFETYASLRIRGAIIDSIRKLDWVPRGVREQNKILKNAYKTVEARVNRDPTNKELAQELGISTDELIKLINKNSVSSLISLDEYDEKNSGNITYSGEKERYAPDANVMEDDRKTMLITALEYLNEKEKYVINLYYFDELTFKEIGEVLSVSESRISQIHSKAILKLSMKLGDKKDILMSL
ncbi:MAG: sigma-70 family RNA polymerase sigma factor [Lachnospirales bacterium]